MRIAKIVLCVLGVAACGFGNEASDIQVLSRAPNPRGRYLCRVDSIATAYSHKLTARCDVGGDTSYIVRNDTVVMVERYEVAPDADASVSMLDYWKRYLAPRWEKRMGGRPTSIGEGPRDNFDYFEAYWDKPDRTRELLTISRRADGEGVPQKRVVKWETLDCRETGTDQPIGCR